MVILAVFPPSLTITSVNNKNEKDKKVDRVLAINDLRGLRLMYIQETNNAGFANHVKPAGHKKNPKVPENKIAKPSPTSPGAFSVSKQIWVREIINNAMLAVNIILVKDCFRNAILIQGG